MLTPSLGLWQQLTHLLQRADGLPALAGAVLLALGAPICPLGICSCVVLGLRSRLSSSTYFLKAYFPPSLWFGLWPV